MWWDLGNGRGEAWSFGGSGGFRWPGGVVLLFDGRGNVGGREVWLLSWVARGCVVWFLVGFVVVAEIQVAAVCVVNLYGIFCEICAVTVTDLLASVHFTFFTEH